MLKHLSLEEIVLWLLGPQGKPLLMNPPVSLFCRALNRESRSHRTFMRMRLIYTTSIQARHPSFFSLGLGLQ
jgi:hypothetical protein